MSLEEQPDSKTDTSRLYYAINIMPVWSWSGGIIRIPAQSSNGSPRSDRVVIKDIEDIYHQSDAVSVCEGECLLQSEVQVHLVVVSP